MIISTNTSELSNAFGDIEAIKILSKNGYDALDYSMFYMNNKNDEKYRENLDDYDIEIDKIIKVAKECNIKFNQTHTPFPTYKDGNEEYNKKIIEILKKSIYISAKVGAKQAIVHPIFSSENPFEKNIEFYNSLLPYAKEYGIVICLENMFSWKDRIIPASCGTGEDFVRHMEKLDKNYFKACLDLGHAGLVGDDAADMIYALGHDRLCALHVHDNDFIDDLHTLPFTQKMDWMRITKALKDIDYTGDLTFEADEFIAKMPKELKIEASEFMLKVGRHLANMIGL